MSQTRYTVRFQDGAPITELMKRLEWIMEQSPNMLRRVDAAAQLEEILFNAVPALIKDPLGGRVVVLIEEGDEKFCVRLDLNAAYYFVTKGSVVYLFDVSFDDGTYPGARAIRFGLPKLRLSVAAAKLLSKRLDGSGMPELKRALRDLFEPQVTNDRLVNMPLADGQHRTAVILKAWHAEKVLINALFERVVRWSGTDKDLLVRNGQAVAIKRHRPSHVLRPQFKAAPTVKTVRFGRGNDTFLKAWIMASRAKLFGLHAPSQNGMDLGKLALRDDGEGMIVNTQKGDRTIRIATSLQSGSGSSENIRRKWDGFYEPSNGHDAIACSAMHFAHVSLDLNLGLVCPMPESFLLGLIGPEAPPSTPSKGKSCSEYVVMN